MFCPYCGKEIREDFVYCLNCGRMIPFAKAGIPTGSSERRDGDSQRQVETPVKQAGVRKNDEVRASSGSNRLEVDFRALVKRLPSEALSHFKNADKDVWQVVKAGLPAEDVFKRHGLVGPYAVKICGVVYHAYAKEDQLAASQVRFLSTWSGGAKKGIRRSRRQLVSLREEMPKRFVSLVAFFAILLGILLAVHLLAQRWGGHF